MDEINYPELEERWKSNSGETIVPVVFRIWLDRGDWVCCYENVDLSSPGQGECQWLSYGSEAAMLTRSQFPDGPPQKMPDIGTHINYRFWLEYVVKEA